MIQAMDKHGLPLWTTVYLVSHRDLTTKTAFTVLSSGNGITVTLSDRHMVYTTDAMGRGSLPAAAKHVQVPRGLRQKSVEESTCS